MRIAKLLIVTVLGVVAINASAAPKCNQRSGTGITASTNPAPTSAVKPTDKTNTVRGQQ